jgi:hypothetical protein
MIDESGVSSSPETSFFRFAPGSRWCKAGKKCPHIVRALPGSLEKKREFGLVCGLFGRHT